MCHRQLRVKDLPKVPTWRLERNSNPRPSGRKALTLPMPHNVPISHYVPISLIIWQLETDRNCIFHFRPKTKLAPKLTFWLGRKRKRKRNCIASFGRKRKRKRKRN